jgi:diazepam-binding inhibitor (GABA receptor modulating acyl-CoA-binding protein)
MISPPLSLPAGRPGIFDQTGRAKWDAWETKKGMTSEEAMTAYIALVAELQAKYA